jgi:hypothetical protein
VFGKSEATDPRDRLFALLGLASDGDDPSLIPNYVESIEIVFLRYSNRFVRHGDGINLLYQAVGASKTDLSIPSWVPDCKITYLKKNSTFPFCQSIVAPHLLLGLSYRTVYTLIADGSLIRDTGAACG